VRFSLPDKEWRRLYRRAYRAQQRDQSEVCGLVEADSVAFGTQNFGRVVRTSPSGDRFIGSNGTGLSIADLDGRIVWEFPLGPYADGAICLSADGQRAAVQGRHQIAIVSVFTKQVESIPDTETFDDEQPRSLGCAPDGHGIAYELRGRIFVYDRRTKRSAFLTDGHDPTWSPDGQWIAFRSLNNTAALMNVSSGQTRTLLAARKIWGSLRWSPDSQYLLFGDDGTSVLKIMVTMPISDGEVKARVGICRIRDGADWIVLDTLAVGTLERYSWVIRKRIGD
jgi:WD40 repeat protein